MKRVFFALLYRGLNSLPPYRFRNLILLCLVLAVAGSSSLFGQFIQSPPLQTLDLQDGMASNRVGCVTEDHLGYIWVATWFGLHRYHGYGFDTWQHQPGDANSLTGNLIYWVMEDSQHRIWVACRSGLNLLDPVTGDITRFVNDPEDTTSLSFNWVEHVYEDGSGVIWASTGDGRLNRFEERDSSFRYWRPRHPEAHDLRMFGTKDDPEDPNKLWIMADRELYTFDKEKETFSQIQDPNYDGIAASGLFDLEFDGDSLLWIASWGRGIIRYDLRSGAMEEFGYFTEAEKEKGKYEVVMNLEPKNAEEFWVVSSKGPGIFHKKKGTFQFATDELARQGENLNLSTSRALCIDRNGIVWVGGSEGLNRLDPNMHRFEFYPLHASNSAIPTRFVVTDVVEAAQGGDLYVSTQNGDGLYIVDGMTDQYHTVPLPLDTFRNHQFVHFLDDMLMDREDRLLVLTINAMFIYAPKTNRLEPYFSRSDLQLIYSDFFPFHFAEDSAGNLWFGSLRNGIMQYNQEEDTLLIYRQEEGNPNSLVSNDDIYEVLPAQDGNIWVSTHDGVSCLDPESGLFRNFPSRPGSSIGLPATDLREMVMDDQGKLWIGTLFNGVYRLDPGLGPDQTMLHLNHENGLLHNSVTSLRKDKEGQVWATSEKGVSVIHPVEMSIRTFEEADGLVFFKTNMAVHAGASGHMYLGAQGGFLRSHPDSLLKNPSQPFVALEDFRVNGQPAELEKDINYLDTLLLEADENFFSFEMVALNYSNSRKNQYRYQLEGVDPDWVEAGTRRYVSYSDLSGGWYHLAVMASNNDGVWNPEPRHLVIYIAFPWYQQWWFLVLCGLSAIGLVFLIIQLRSRQVRKEEQLKSEFVQRIQEVEMAALRAQMNPHFLFNCLNSINRYIIRNEPRQASEYLADFAVLIRMILHHSQQEQILLSEELKALKLYVQMEALRFEERFAFEVEIDPDVDVDFIRVPPLILQPFVENAIWHGLMHQSQRGLLRLEIEMDQDFVICSIRDNGVGRVRAGELRSKSAPLHKSMGMDITASRLDNLGALNGVQSSIEVVDLYDDNNVAQGTLVILKIPI